MTSWIAREPPRDRPLSLATVGQIGRVAAAALTAGLGVAALRVTIVARDDTPPAFIIVGPSIAQIGATVAAIVAAVLLAHWMLLRAASRTGTGDSEIRSGAYAMPLVAGGLPVAGVAAAMSNANPAPALVYWFWEMGPWWMLVAGMSTALAALNAIDVRRRPSVRLLDRAPVWFWHVALAFTVVGWIVVSNPSLRTWHGPVGDEPRYLRYLESWSQGGGVDISRVSRLSDVPRDSPPHVLQAVGLAARTLAADAKSLAEDVKASLTQSGFTWNRVTAGDGTFVTGRGGGVFQTHQPGLALLLLPGYVIDRYWISSGTVYLEQFPDRLPMVHATLLAIAALGAVGLAVLCRRIGLGPVGAAAFAFLGWASFPPSAMALQVYPETSAASAALGALALLTGAPFSWRRAVLIGLIAGFPWFFHVRFVLMSVVLLAVGLWTLRGSRPLVTAFVCGWICPVAAQIWFVYHATGVPWPTGFYQSPEERLLLLGSAVPHNALRFIFDRDWGILAHAPVLILAPAGFAPLWRARRDLAIAAGAVAILLLCTSSTRNVIAGGGTPGRLVTAMVPLLLLPVAALIRERGSQPALSVSFVVLSALTLDQAWDYNRSHVKEAGVLVSPGAGGWRVNLLFPYLSAGVTRTAAAAVAAVAIPIIALMRFTARRPRPDGTLRVRRGVYGLIAVAAVVVAAITAAGAWTLSHPRYRHQDRQARAALVGAYVRAGSCSLCWSSRKGPLSAQKLAPNSLDALTLRAISNSRRQVRLHLDAAGPDGPVFGTVRFDFADGEFSSPRVMAGTLDVTHRYRTAGDYRITAWFSAAGDSPRLATASVHVTDDRSSAGE